MPHECPAAGQADCARTSLRRARAARPVAGQCEGPERARRGYKPLDHFTDEHAPSRRSYVTTPRGVAHFRPARFVAGGQLGSGQSTDESGSTHGNVKGPARTCGNFMCPASKSGLQNDATISADCGDGRGIDMGPERQVYGFRHSWWWRNGRREQTLEQRLQATGPVRVLAKRTIWWRRRRRKATRGVSELAVSPVLGACRT